MGRGRRWFGLPGQQAYASFGLWTDGRREGRPNGPSAILHGPQRERGRREGGTDAMPDIYRPPPTTTTSAKFVRGGRKGNVGERREKREESGKNAPRGEGERGADSGEKVKKSAGANANVALFPPLPCPSPSFSPLCRRWSGWGMHATASRDGLRTQREGGRFGPLPAPDPELAADVQSHDPPRAKLYHIHSSLETLRSLSPLLFPLCIPDPGHPHQTLPGVCLSVCPHAEQR